MGKKKGGKSNVQQLRPTKSFEQMVNEATLAKVKGFVQQQVQMLGMQLAQEQQNTLRSMYARIMTLEKILQGKFDISDEDLANLVADTEDEASGLLKVSGPVEKGDLVRLVVKSKTRTQEEFAGESPLIVENVGAEPYTLGPEIEPEIVGMADGDVKEIAFGKEEEIEDEDGKKIKVKGMVAQITVNRISRRPKVEEAKKEEKNESKDAK